MPKGPMWHKIGFWVTAAVWLISVAGLVYVYEIHF